MIKKKLSTEAITSELTGASAFFAPRTLPPAATPEMPVAASHQSSTVQLSPPTTEQQANSRQPERAAAGRVEQLTSKQPNMKASRLAGYPDSIIETIRKAVKHPGREVTFIRLTPEEKGRLADIVYTYKRQGVKTSENEISRIAISFLLEDYQANGQESILAEVIASLLA